MAFGKLTIDWRSTIAAVWRSNRHFLKPITNVDLVNPDTLLGLDEQKEAIFRNTENFLRGKPSSHTLLWGARGVGKSSLIKAVLTRYHTYGLRMIQIPKDDLHLLVDITDEIMDSHNRFIIYCDDLTFEESRGEYRMLKNTMEGTLEKPPANVLIYATSNCQQVMPEKMSGEENTTIPTDSELQLAISAEGKVSLADRFGLSLPFPLMGKETYLEIVDKLFKGRVQDMALLHEEAQTFAMERGGYSGRTARHFFNHCHFS
ncbi:MAG: ATP-binding protein [Thiothrix sp.]|jgi:predicted AAA+ superfamily ATPase|uniref:ATP-binding protein n=1 Tax=Thiothrix sp. TaxID=1032 RepID=UPI002616A351|nr:ATP-binding protein [Thiothrix sp.]MDD5391921.1 ATP-binding protein [Thiothrix sp.]